MLDLGAIRIILKKEDGNSRSVAPARARHRSFIEYLCFCDYALLVHSTKPVDWWGFRHVRESDMRPGSHMTEEQKQRVKDAMMRPEVRAKTSERLMGNKYGVGNKNALNPSPETRAKISAANMGRRPSLETRAKLSAAKMGNTNGHGCWKGGRKIASARDVAKRRLLGYTELNSPFPGRVGHHVDNEQVIYIPGEIHRSVYHRQRDGWGMAKINALAYNFLFKQEVTVALADHV